MIFLMFAGPITGIVFLYLGARRKERWRSLRMLTAGIYLFWTAGSLWLAAVSLLWGGDGAR